MSNHIVRYFVEHSEAIGDDTGSEDWLTLYRALARLVHWDPTAYKLMQEGVLDHFIRVWINAEHPLHDRYTSLHARMETIGDDLAEIHEYEYSGANLLPYLSQPRRSESEATVKDVLSIVANAHALHVRVWIAHDEVENIGEQLEQPRIQVLEDESQEGQLSDWRLFWAGGPVDFPVYNLAVRRRSSSYIFSSLVEDESGKLLIEFLLSQKFQVPRLDELRWSWPKQHAKGFEALRPTVDDGDRYELEHLQVWNEADPAAGPAPDLSDKLESFCLFTATVKEPHHVEPAIKLLKEAMLRAPAQPLSIRIEFGAKAPLKPYCALDAEFVNFPNAEKSDYYTENESLCGMLSVAVNRHLCISFDLLYMLQNADASTVPAIQYFCREFLFNPDILKIWFNFQSDIITITATLQHFHQKTARPFHRVYNGNPHWNIQSKPVEPSWRTATHDQHLQHEMPQWMTFNPIDEDKSCPVHDNSQPDPDGQRNCPCKGTGNLDISSILDYLARQIGLPRRSEWWHRARHNFNYHAFLAEMLGSHERVYPFLRHCKNARERHNHLRNIIAFADEQSKAAPAISSTTVEDHKVQTARATQSRRGSWFFTNLNGPDVEKDADLMGYIIGDVVSLALVFRYIFTTDDRRSLLVHFENVFQNAKDNQEMYTQPRQVESRLSRLPAQGGIPLIEDNPHSWIRETIMGFVPTTSVPLGRLPSRSSLVWEHVKYFFQSVIWFYIKQFFTYLFDVSFPGFRDSLLAALLTLTFVLGAPAAFAVVVYVSTCFLSWLLHIPAARAALLVAIMLIVLSILDAVILSIALFRWTSGECYNAKQNIVEARATAAAAEQARATAEEAHKAANEAAEYFTELDGRGYYTSEPEPVSDDIQSSVDTGETSDEDENEAIITPDFDTNEDEMQPVLGDAAPDAHEQDAEDLYADAPDAMDTGSILHDSSHIGIESHSAEAEAEEGAAAQGSWAGPHATVQGGEQATRAAEPGGDGATQETGPGREENIQAKVQGDEATLAAFPEDEEAPAVLQADGQNGIAAVEVEAQNSDSSTDEALQLTETDETSQPEQDAATVALEAARRAMDIAADEAQAAKAASEDAEEKAQKAAEAVEAILSVVALLTPLFTWSTTDIEPLCGPVYRRVCSAATEVWNTLATPFRTSYDFVFKVALRAGKGILICSLSVLHAADPDVLLTYLALGMHNFTELMLIRWTSKLWTTILESSWTPWIVKQFNRLLLCSLEALLQVFSILLKMYHQGLDHCVQRAIEAIDVELPSRPTTPPEGKWLPDVSEAEWSEHVPASFKKPFDCSLLTASSYVEHERRTLALHSAKFRETLVVQRTEEGETRAAEDDIRMKFLKCYPAHAELYDPCKLHMPLQHFMTPLPGGEPVVYEPPYPLPVIRAFLSHKTDLVSRIRERQSLGSPEVQAIIGAITCNGHLSAYLLEVAEEVKEVLPPSTEPYLPSWNVIRRFASLWPKDRLLLPMPMTDDPHCLAKRRTWPSHVMDYIEQLTDLKKREEERGRGGDVEPFELDIADFFDPLGRRYASALLATPAWNQPESWRNRQPGNPILKAYSDMIDSLTRDLALQLKANPDMTRPWNMPE